MLRSAVLLITTFALGCNPSPWFPPPAQRTLLPPLRLDAVVQFVAMNQMNAEMFFVRDIHSLQGGLWRWTGKKPTLRFRVPETGGLSFAADLVIPDVMFRVTGPVTVAVTVNGNLLDTVSYTEGAKHFQKQVPAEWLHAGEESVVSLEIDRIWTPPQGGEPLGFILVRAGFVQ